MFQHCVPMFMHTHIYAHQHIHTRIQMSTEAAWSDDLPIYVDPGCNAVVPDGAVLAPDLHSGRIFVVPDPCNCREEVRFMAGLVGGLLVTKDFVESKGVRGVALAYKPAIKSKRHVFVTPAFMRQHAQLCVEFSGILQLQDCNFQLLNRASLQDMIGKLNVSRARQLVILRSDAGDEVFPDAVRLVFTLSEAVAHFVFCTEDKSRSRSGIAPTY